MPKITRKLGSGMTERGIVEFDWVVPGDLQAQIRAAIETFERSSFQRLSHSLTELATAILDEAGLPADPEKQYLVSSEEGWAVIEVETDLSPELADAHLSFSKVMEIYRVPPDSPEGYAARVLLLLQRAKDQLQAGVTDDAMATSFAAGELVTEAAMKGLFEKDYLSGAEARERMRKVHEETYGTPEKMEARDEAIRRAVDTALAKGFPKMKVYKAAAMQFRTGVSTIRRVVRKKANEG